MKGTGYNYTIPRVYYGSTGKLVYEDKANVDLLNQYFCSIISINDSNREPPIAPHEQTLYHQRNIAECGVKHQKSINQSIQNHFTKLPLIIYN